MQGSGLRAERFRDQRPVVDLNARVWGLGLGV